MNARPIWTQSGIGPKFLRSRVNEALDYRVKMDDSAELFTVILYDSNFAVS